MAAVSSVAHPRALQAFSPVVCASFCFTNGQRRARRRVTMAPSAARAASAPRGSTCDGAVVQPQPPVIIIGRPLSAATPLSDGPTPLSAGGAAPLSDGPTPLSAGATPLSDGPTPLSAGPTPLSAGPAPESGGTIPESGVPAMTVIMCVARFHPSPLLAPLPLTALPTALIVCAPVTLGAIHVKGIVIEVAPAIRDSVDDCVSSPLATRVLGALVARVPIVDPMLKPACIRVADSITKRSMTTSFGAAVVGPSMRTIVVVSAVGLWHEQPVVVDPVRPPLNALAVEGRSATAHAAATKPKRAFLFMGAETRATLARMQVLRGACQRARRCGVFSRQGENLRRRSEPGEGRGPVKARR